MTANGYDSTKDGHDSFLAAIEAKKARGDRHDWEKPNTFLDGKIELRPGDCREVIRAMPDNSVDSVVTDPPYALVSIVKRFGKNGAAPATGNPVYQRVSRGFMGQTWDHGAVVFDPTFWAEVYRVLKPGGHVVSFSGTRTYHRMTCAIEDAGFEIRDQLAWVYGSGFPKSHDVSKAIDKAGAAQLGWFGPWLRQKREQLGISQRELAERGGFYDKVNRGGLVANWELGYGIPSAAQFNKVCELLDLPFERIEEVEREIIGSRKVHKGLAFSSDGKDAIDITTPATDAARQWQGWGSALKPAWEPICLARKPLIGTIAENVLAHGTGALNVDGCRVGMSEADAEKIATMGGFGKATYQREIGVALELSVNPMACIDAKPNALGRWPANLIHDGSAEVLAGFPEAKAAYGNEAAAHAKTAEHKRCNGEHNTFAAGLAIKPCGSLYADSGSAARYFYTAKADQRTRLGARHPTVKPLDLMQWLVRLVTPKGGLVLDPFAGTGTTGEAAWREGMRALLIEREEDSCADIRIRMSLAKEYARREAIAKTKRKLKGAEGTPLFPWMKEGHLL